MNGAAETYEDKMLKAFSGQDKKFFYYKKKFAKFNINGLERFTLSWNWNSFFWGIIYSLYKKLYWVALAQLTSVILLRNFIWAHFIINTFALPTTIDFFIYKRYAGIKKLIEQNIQGEQARVETMWKYD